MKQTKRTEFRTTDEIHIWLTERAKLNDRSMNAEMNRIIRREMEREQKKVS